MFLKEQLDSSHPLSLTGGSLVNLESRKGKNSVITGQHVGTSNVVYHINPQVSKYSPEDFYYQFMQKLAVYSSFQRTKAPAPRTCEWLVSCAEYQQWRGEDDPQVIWLVGGPGMGKTILSAYLVRDLKRFVTTGCKEELVAEDENDQKPPQVACYFCDATDSRRNNPKGILGGLLRQLLTNRKKLFLNSRAIYPGDMEAMFQEEDLDALWTFFRDILEGISERIYLIIDGLDECSAAHTKRFVELLASEVRANQIGPHVKFLISSRPEPLIEQHINSLATSLKVSPGNVENDVIKAIGYKLDDMGLTIAVGEEKRKKIEDALINKSGQTFLWVDLVFENLISKISFDQDLECILEILNQLPQGLDEVYDKILVKIYSHEPERATFVLPFVAIARRPLAVADIDIAFALWKDSSIRDTIPQVRIHGVHRSCVPFVFCDDETNTVSLVHLSAKDYLLSDRPNKLLKRLNYICCSLLCLTGLVHQYFLFLSLLCLIYQVQHVMHRSPLSFFALAKPIVRFDKWQALVKRVRINSHWPANVRNIRIGSDQANLLALQVSLAYLSNQKFDHGRKIIRREKVYRLIPVFNDLPASESNSFVNYAAIHWQNHALEMDPTVVVKYLRKLESFSGLDTLRDSLFLSAAQYGHEGLLRFLVNEMGARLNVVDQFGKTALHLAAFGGHLDVVQLLLSYGVDQHMKDDVGAKAIHLAVRGGRVETFQYLLTQHSHSNLCTGTSRIITQYLVNPFTRLFAHWDLTNLITPNFEMPDNDGATLLAWAIEGGSEEIVQFLLSHKVKTDYIYPADIRRDIPLMDDPEQFLGAVDDLVDHFLERTPLSRAAGKGYEPIIKLLLANGANLNFEDTLGRTAMFWAAKRGHESSINMLTADGIDHKKQLAIAIISGDKLATENLLRFGIVDPNTSFGDNDTPLFIAVAAKQDHIMKSLLQNFAKPDLKSCLGMTPLAWAAYSGNEKIIRLLLDTRKVNLNSINEFGHTPLCLAVMSGNQSAFNILMGTEMANIHSRCSVGKTITSFAAQRGNQAIFDMLSPHDQHYTIGDKLRRTPIFYAIKGGNHQIVQSILSSPKVSVEAKDAFGALPLSMAARFGDTTSAALLLRENPAAQLRSKDRFGRSPLAWCAIEGHTATRDFFLKRCKELGIRTSDEAIPPVTRRTKRVEGSHCFCDICFLNTGNQEPYYTCSKCFNGGFVICCECRDRLRPQPGCLQDSHEIFLSRRRK